MLIYFKKHHHIRLLFFLCLFKTTLCETEPCFIAINEHGTIVCQQGTGHDERLSPCSTFKIALSLMGFDAGILVDEQLPQWTQNNTTHSPQTWIKNCVVWYSQQLTQQLGLDHIKQYLAAFDYGNQDMSGDFGKNNGLSWAWLNSSLTISPREQVTFLQKLVHNQLPVSPYAIKITKKLFFEQTLENGWQLFGKTGSGYTRNTDGTFSDNYIAWYVGWLEKDSQAIVFALSMHGIDELPTKTERIELVKKYLLSKI